MNIKHHPDDATLMSYAAGSLPSALSAVVACHLSVCRRCAHEVSEMEQLGGLLLEQAGTSATHGGAPVAALRTLGPIEDKDEPAINSAWVPGRVPHPIARYVGDDLKDLQWKRLGFGVWHIPIAISDNSKGDLRLLKVAPGQVMPEHGHGGSELTLLLDGSYRDEFGHFGIGDLADLDDEAEHTPVADPKTGCICLIASEERARFKGLVARLVQPLTGM